MRAHRFAPPLVWAVIAALGLGAVGWADDGDDDDSSTVVELEDASLFFELNDTDGDLGLQARLGGEPWREMKIVAPDGKTILVVKGKGDLKEFGLSELFFESNEPSFDDMTRDEILELFPEGEYEFEGETIEGEELEGEATLSHDIPDAPEICSPEEDDVVDPDDVEIEWKAVTTPAGIEIAYYQVTVIDEDDSVLEFSVHLPSTATSVSVPSEFMEPGRVYELEVLAIAANGNQTISKIFFETEEE